MVQDVGEVLLLIPHYINLPLVRVAELDLLQIEVFGKNAKLGCFYALQEHLVFTHLMNIFNNVGIAKEALVLLGYDSSLQLVFHDLIALVYMSLHCLHGVKSVPRNDAANLGIPIQAGVRTCLVVLGVHQSRRLLYRLRFKKLLCHLPLLVLLYFIGVVVLYDSCHVGSHPSGIGQIS